MNHYPRHVGDFIRATIGLSLAERGAYNALLDQYYANEAPLPLDAKERYRMVGATSKADRVAVDYVVGRYFIEQADGWHNKRADAEIAMYQIRADKARENGAKGGRPPNPTETDRVISANPEITGSKTNPEPVTSNQEPEPKKQGQGQGQERVARKRAPAGKPATRTPKTPIPDDFSISDRVRQWASENGLDRLTEHLASFRMKCQANAYAYADWDAAFMEAIRGNWARLGDAPPTTAANANPAMQRLTRVGQQSAESLKRWIDNEGVRNGTDGP